MFLCQKPNSHSASLHWGGGGGGGNPWLFTTLHPGKSIITTSYFLAGNSEKLQQSVLLGLIADRAYPPVLEIQMNMLSEVTESCFSIEFDFIFDIGDTHGLDMGKT